MFHAILSNGSITAAAEAMNVAPSAIATALGQAEDAFGIALVTRARSKGIFPTSAGRDVQRRIDDLLERYDGLLAGVSDLVIQAMQNTPPPPPPMPASPPVIVEEHHFIEPGPWRPGFRRPPPWFRRDVEPGFHWGVSVSN